MPTTYTSDNVLPTIPEPKKQDLEEEQVLPELSDDVTPTRKEDEIFDVKQTKKKKTKKQVTMTVKEDLELDIDAELSKLKTAGRKKGTKDTKQRKKRYNGKMSQQALDNLAKARAKAAANRKRRKELLELKKQKEDKKATIKNKMENLTSSNKMKNSTSSNKMEIKNNIVNSGTKVVAQKRRQPTKEEIETNFFNMMDKYYLKRDKMKAERKQKALREAKSSHRRYTRPAPTLVKTQSHQFNNWDSLF